MITSSTSEENLIVPKDVRFFIQRDINKSISPNCLMETLDNLGKRKKTVFFGGIVYVDSHPEMKIVAIIRPGIFPRGWAYLSGDEPRFKKGIFRVSFLMNPRRTRLLISSFHSTILNNLPFFSIYIAGEVDRSLVSFFVQKKRIEDLVDWTLPQIVDIPYKFQY